MRLAALYLVIGALCAFASRKNTVEPAHQSCSWCHTPTKMLVKEVKTNGAVKTWRTSKATFTMCLSCHDGSTAGALDRGHPNHVPGENRAGLDCLVCHNPHDKSGSYRLLRGKNGAETEKTAVLAFCRECHTDH
jgi:hypothetical protein